MEFSRRSMMRCGLAGLAVAATPVLAAKAAVHPVGPMRLARRLERGLADGNAIVVERVWSIAFKVGGPGLLVSGEQLSVSVEAPEVLARIAQIEEQRDTSAMFPIMLSPSGEILGSGTANDTSDIVEAVELAEMMISRIGGDGADHRRNLAAIQAAGGQLLDSMPRDLFFPKESAWSDQRTLALPGGGTGSIAVRYEALTAYDATWLARAERTVTTTVGETSSSSREIWTLERD